MCIKNACKQKQNMKVNYSTLKGVFYGSAHAQATRFITPFAYKTIEGVQMTIAEDLPLKISRSVTKT